MATCGVCAEEMAALCDGLLLTGGADMDPELYGEEKLNDSVKPLPERTAFEKPLFEAFLKRGKPILGICRGSQLINVCLGGTLYQDLLAQKDEDFQPEEEPDIPEDDINAIMDMLVDDDGVVLE